MRPPSCGIDGCAAAATKAVITSHGDKPYKRRFKVCELHHRRLVAIGMPDAGDTSLTRGSSEGGPEGDCDPSGPSIGGAPFVDVERIVVVLSDGREIAIVVPPHTRHEDCSFRLTMERPVLAFEDRSPNEQIEAAARGYLLPSFGEPVYTLSARATLKAANGARIVMTRGAYSAVDDPLDNELWTALAYIQHHAADMAEVRAVAEAAATKFRRDNGLLEPEESASQGARS